MHSGLDIQKTDRKTFDIKDTEGWTYHQLFHSSQGRNSSWYNQAQVTTPIAVQPISRPK